MLFLIIGLVLILVGANALTDGASAIARRFNISDLVIGLTIVAFGTSMPELVVSTMSAINGSGDMALGNIVGSNLFNILVILGATALVRPIHVERSTITRDVPFVLLSSLVVCFVALDVFIDGAETCVVTRSEGLMLLGLFAIFLRYTFAIAHNGTDDQPEEGTVKHLSLPMGVLYSIGGLVGLVVGGQLFVDGATDIARWLGVSEAVIGLTILAGGTSLPELAASIVAALKGKGDMAIGNVVGSCIFNVFLIIGTSATIAPMNIVGLSLLDFGMLVGASVLFLLFARFYKDRTITRVEGSLLLAVYVAYIAYLVSNA